MRAMWMFFTEIYWVSRTSVRLRVYSEHCTLYRHILLPIVFHQTFFIFDVSLLINPFAFNTLHLYTSIWKRQIAITIQYARQCLDKMKQFLCWELWLPQLKAVCGCVFVCFMTLLMLEHTAKVSHKMKRQTLKWEHTHNLKLT